MYYLSIAIILIMSIIIHEISHGYAALALGDPTAKYSGRLTLNPASHLDPIGSFFVPLLGILLGGVVIGWAKPVPFNPYNLKNQRWGEALVAAAGPISNVLIATVFSIFVRVVSAGGVMGHTEATFMAVAVYVVLINVNLAIFNLMPIPPLDGSKIIFSVLPYRWQKVRFFLENLNLVFVLVFAIFFWQFLSPLVNWVFSLLVGQPLLL